MSTHARSTLRTTAAIAAVVGVAARVISIFLWPPNSDGSHAEMLATAAEHPAAWNAATAAEVVAWLTAGFAILVVASCVSASRSPRGRVLTRLGGWLYGASLIVLGLVGGAMNSITAVIAAEPDRAAMVRVQDHLSTPVLAAFIVFVMLGELLLIVFGVGLARAKAVGWWFVAVSVAAVAGYVLTSDSSDHLVVLAGFVPLGATWLVLARLLVAPQNLEVASGSAGGPKAETAGAGVGAALGGASAGLTC
ncbi:MAG: hypothetical protein ACTHMW_12885 [Actinomycetes bacterium]